MYDQYFGASPAYTDQSIRRRFRRSKRLLQRVRDTVTASDSYFRQLPDAISKLGISSLLNVTAALRVLENGPSADSLNDNMMMGESPITTYDLAFHKWYH